VELAEKNFCLPTGQPTKGKGRVDASLLYETDIESSSDTSGVAGGEPPDVDEVDEPRGKGPRSDIMRVAVTFSCLT